MDDFAERRKLPRIRVSWPVTVYTSAGELTGETKNLTPSGASIQCKERLNLNETCWLQIRVPRHDLMLMGKVVWSDLVIEKTGADVSHAGLSFIHIEGEDREILRDAIMETEH